MPTRAHHRAPADEGAPVEGEAQHDLRPMGETLQKRIDGDEDERGGAELDGEGVELDQHQEADEGANGGEGQRLGRRHLAGGDGAARRARGARVVVAVDVVVVGAARSAHRAARRARTGSAARGWGRAGAARPRRGPPTTSRAAAAARSRWGGRGERAAGRGARIRAHSGRPSCRAAHLQREVCSGWSKGWLAFRSCALGSGPTLAVAPRSKSRIRNHRAS